MNSRRQPWILWVAFFIGLIGSLWSAFDRNNIEQSSKQVELVLDYDSITDLAAKEGVPVSFILSKARQAGITSIALSEMTLERLKLNGQIVWYSGDELIKNRNFLSPDIKSKHVLQSIDIVPSNVYVLGNINIISNRFRNLLGKHRVKEYNTDSGSHNDDRVVLEITGKSDELKDLGLGVDDNQAEFIQNQYGFSIVPRIENKENISQQKISIIFDSIKKPSLLVFSGVKNEVLGYRNFIFDTADIMRKKRYIFGSVEVYDKGKTQKGSQLLASLLKEQIVRVQTIPPLQIAKITPDRAIDMFMLGVSERNIRVIYLRPFMMMPDIDFTANEPKNLIDVNMSFFENLSNELKAHGFKTGQASVFPLFERSLFVSVFAVIGVIGAFALTMYYCGYLFKTYLYIAGSVSFVVITAAFWHHDALWGVWSKVIAILTGIVFSVFASLSGWMLILKNEKKRTVWLIILSSCIMSATSVIGGLMIAAILRGNIYMLGIDQVRGIKLILLFPPVVVFLILFAMRHKESGRFIELFQSQVRFWHVILLGILMGIVLLLLVRSGNAPEELVPQWELTLRRIFEHLLVVRPRFKEFLLGYPAIFIGAYFLRRGYKQIVPFAAFFATIGLSGCIDTFAHLHTPLWVSLLRTFHALWIGIIIGLVAWGFLSLRDKALIKNKNLTSSE